MFYTEGLIRVRRRDTTIEKDMTIISARNEPVTTNREDIVQQYLDKLGICYKRNAIYCFSCKDYFIHKNGNAPNKCFVGNHPFNGKGQWCIPDFLLLSPLFQSVKQEYDWTTGEEKDQKYEVWSDQCKERPANMIPRARLIGVIMVNEKIHYKNIEKRNQVADQVRHFTNAGMKVFVMREQDIDEMTDLSMTAMIYYISKATMNSSLHELYSLGNEYKERTASYRELTR